MRDASLKCGRSETATVLFGIMHHYFIRCEVAEVDLSLDRKPRRINDLRQFVRADYAADSRAGIAVALSGDDKTNTTFLGRNHMQALFSKLYHDEAGVIVSGELVVISTIAVLGMVVGLTEVASSANNELEDVGAAVGSINQSYEYAGIHGAFACPDGSSFTDFTDFCDDESDLVSVSATSE